MKPNAQIKLNSPLNRGQEHALKNYGRKKYGPALMTPKAASKNMGRFSLNLWGGKINNNPPGINLNPLPVLLIRTHSP